MAFFAKAHPGIDAKRAWLRNRLAEGHVFRKIRSDGCAFIEYAPLEHAWTPIVGENYLYIYWSPLFIRSRHTLHTICSKRVNVSFNILCALELDSEFLEVTYCLWVDGAMKKHGYGKLLMESCLRDARDNGSSGVCMLGADKQKAWLSSQSFAARFGFTTADTTGNGYSLLALSFDGTTPRFPDSARKMTIPEKELTIYYDFQCPFIPARMDMLRQHCLAKKIPAQFIAVNSVAAAKKLPCVFNNWAVFFGGQFVTVNQIDRGFVDRLVSGTE